MTDSKSVWKHKFLAQSVFRYRISYDTRLSKNADFCEKSLPHTTVELSTEVDARPKSDNRVKASLREQIGFAESFANGFSRLNDEEKGALNTTSAQLTKLKRGRESNHRSWLKRQRHEFVFFQNFLTS